MIAARGRSTLVTVCGTFVPEGSPGVTLARRNARRMLAG